MALIQVRVRPTVRTRTQMGASGSFAGGFEDTTFEPLITTEQMVEAMKTARQITGRYNTPNHDEIDRILLEE